MREGMGKLVPSPEKKKTENFENPPHPFLAVFVFVLQRLLHFRQASVTNSFALVLGKHGIASAEEAGWLELAQNDAVVFGEKLNLVAAVDVHLAAHFLREDQTAHLVNNSYNTGVLHFFAFLCRVFDGKHPASLFRAAYLL